MHARISLRTVNSLIARHVCEEPPATLSNSIARGSGNSVPIETTPIPVRVVGTVAPRSPGTSDPVVQTCQASLGGTVQVGVQDRDRFAQFAQRAGELHRHGALAHAPFAGSDRQQVANAGEVSRDALLLGLDLLEDLRAPVARDVVVALHAASLA